jgi:L-amino acid N-acyltransferase YncA
LIRPVDPQLIRPVDAQSDAAAIAAIYAPYVAGSAVSFEEDPPGAPEFQRRIERITKTHPWLVAQAGDGTVAGYAYATHHRDRAAYRWAADVAVYVAQGHQRSGVGTRLYEELFNRLRDQKIRIAVAGITLPNPGSVALHEAFGFQPVGVYRNIGWKAGAWRDVGWWQLELVAPTDGQPPEPVAVPPA